MANKEMKTFTAGDVTYDIVDQPSRDRITNLENNQLVITNNGGVINITSNSSNNIGMASSTEPGFMSSADKIKLDEMDGQQIQVDSYLSLYSSNPVQNNVITSNMNNKVDNSKVLTFEEIQASTDLTGKIADAEAVFRYNNTSYALANLTHYKSGSLSVSSTYRPYTFTSTEKEKIICYEFTATIKNTSNYFCDIFLSVANGKNRIEIPLIRSSTRALASVPVILPENTQIYCSADGIDDTVYYTAYCILN